MQIKNNNSYDDVFDETEYKDNSSDHEYEDSGSEYISFMDNLSVRSSVLNQFASNLSDESETLDIFPRTSNTNTSITRSTLNEKRQ